MLLTEKKPKKRGKNRITRKKMKTRKTPVEGRKRGDTNDQEP